MSTFFRVTKLPLYASLLVATLGCSTHAKRLVEPRNLFHSNQLVECRTKLDKLIEVNRTDRDVAMLDLAMVDLVSGEAKKAESGLREVRDRFEHLEQESLAEETISIWTDDQKRAYAGEDYEKVLIRAFLAISNLMHDGGDAESYAIQVEEKQSQLNQQAIEKYGDETAQCYQPVALSYYLRGMLREASHRDYDDAESCYGRVCELFPSTVPFGWDYERARSGVHSSPGCGVLYLFALVGRGPMKIEVTEEATSDALLIADRIVSAVGPYSVPPTIAPLKVPGLSLPAIGVEQVLVTIDQQPLGPTSTITDIEQLSIGSYEAKRKANLARAVARRVLKKSSIVAAKTTMGKDNLSSLAMDAAGVVWEATESADTRCWGLLPREIQVIRVELPSGTHAMNLTPLLSNRPLSVSHSVSVPIADGRNTYALCCYPDSRRLGEILVSQPQ